MASEKGVISFFTFLVIVVAIIAVILVLQDRESGNDTFEAQSSTNATKEIVVIKTGDMMAEPEKRIIVTDRYVRGLDPDARIVAISGDGEAYSVRKGNVLVSDMVISVDDGEYVIYRVDDPEKSVMG